MKTPLLRWLYHTFAVHRRDMAATDNRGNEIPVYSSIGSHRGKLEFQSGSEDVAGREVSISRLRAIFDKAPDIQTIDRLVMGTRTFEVRNVLVRYDLVGRPHHTSVWLEEIDG